MKRAIYLSIIIVFIVSFISIPFAYNSINFNLNKNKTNIHSQIVDQTSINKLAPSYSVNLKKDVNISQQPVNINPEDTKTVEGSRSKEQDGYFNLACSDVESTFQNAKDIASAFEGYIVSSNFNNDGNTYSTIIMRVPSNKFDQSIQRIKSLNGTIITENINTQDKQNHLTEALKTQDNVNSKIKDYKNQLLTEKDEIKKSQLNYELSNLQLQKINNDNELQILQAQTSYSTIQIDMKSNNNFNIINTTGNPIQNILNILKTVIVFWVEVAIYISIPLLILVILFKLLFKKSNLLNPKTKV